MQDSEKKEIGTIEEESAAQQPRRGRHAQPAPETEAAQQESGIEEGILEEEELLGDEGDIPLRKKKKKAAEKPKKKGKRAGKAKAKKQGRIPPLFSEKKFRRKKSLFEIMSASGESGFFKPIHLFGHEIRFWPLFLLVALIVLVGVVVLNNSNVNVAEEKVTMVGLPDDLENYKVLVVSDLNGKRFGDEQSSLLRTVNALNYDLILCVGDMVGKGGDAEPFYEFIDGVKDPSKVYFVCGDADPGPYLSAPRQESGTLEEIVLEDWILGAVERGANYVDAPLCLDVGSSRIWLTPVSYLNLDATENQEDWKYQMRQEEDGVISGVAADYNSLPFTSYRYALAQEYYAAVKQMTASDFIIAMSHIVPNDAFIASSATHDYDANYMTEAELIVSGHYCGGVWQVPVFGAVYVPNRMLPRNGWFPAQEDMSGLSKVSESQVYISGGLHTTSAIPVLPFRLFNGPEIGLLTFTSKLPESILGA